MGMLDGKLVGKLMVMLAGKVVNHACVQGGGPAGRQQVGRQVTKLVGKPA